MAKGTEFGGRIGRDWRDSEPWWPPDPTAPAGAPNVVLVVLDDVGFAQLGCYGSDIATPTIDGLAGAGVRLANFRTTALCSPTRACLLTGRNHHRSGMGRVADLASGFPGYWGKPPKENGYLSEILRENGYATYAVGKWHLTPDDETHMAASRTTWPLARGFDRWYGFHGGETHQFVPALYHDSHSVRPERSIEDGYHLSADLADRAIEFLGDLRAVDGDQPFFLYFCTGACHSPHQAPRSWIDGYRGQFDDGWDAWRERTYARQLELGVIPPGTAALGPAALGTGMGQPGRDGEDGGQPLHGVLRRLPLLHRRPDRPAGRIPPRQRRPRQHRRHPRLRQRGQRRRGPGRLHQRHPVDEPRPGRDSRDVRAAGRDRRPLDPQQLPLGMDHGRATHPSGAGSGRSTRVAWPIPASSRGRPDCRRAPAGIRHQFVHAIDVLPTVLELVGIDRAR
jgi:arylsulfatase A-like enzyme